jgi:hypothetical protein
MSRNTQKSGRRAAQSSRSGGPWSTDAASSAEHRAAVEFVASLQRAGIDPTKPGASDDIQVPTLAAAGMLGIKRQTLALWRCERSQPLRYVKVSRRVCYRLGDLRQFIASRSMLPLQAA